MEHDKPTNSQEQGDTSIPFPSGLPDLLRRRLARENALRSKIDEDTMQEIGGAALISPIFMNLAIQPNWAERLIHSPYFAHVTVKLAPHIAILPSVITEVCRHLEGRRPVCEQIGDELIITFSVMDSGKRAFYSACVFANSVRSSYVDSTETQDDIKVEILESI